MRRAPCHCALRMLARKLSYRFFLPSCPVPYTCRLLLHARFLSTNRSQEVSVAYSRSSRERMGGETFMYIEHPLLSPPHLSSLSLCYLSLLSHPLLCPCPLRWSRSQHSLKRCSGEKQENGREGERLITVGSVATGDGRHSRPAELL